MWKHCTGRHFQPGEGPSRGLLRECENRLLPMNRLQHKVWVWWRWVSTLRLGTLLHCYVATRSPNDQTGNQGNTRKLWHVRFFRQIAFYEEIQTKNWKRCPQFVVKNYLKTKDLYVWKQRFKSPASEDRVLFGDNETWAINKQTNI